MSYKYMLFDFDGTVADTVPLIMETFSYVFTTLTGEDADEKYLLSTIGEPLEKTFDILAPELRSKALELYFEYNKTHLDTGAGIFYNIVRAISSVRSKGVFTGLVTSKRYESAYHTIRQFELEQYFDIIIVREDTIKHKPHPDPVLEALKRLDQTFGSCVSSEPEQVLFIGDSIHDLLSARSAGTRTAVVGWTRMDKDYLRAAKPDHWIDDPYDLIRMCEKGGVG